MGRNKLNPCLISSVPFLVFVFGITATNSEVVSSTPNSTDVGDENLSGVLQRLETAEKDIQELKNLTQSHDDLVNQFTALSSKLGQLEKNISSVWLLAPPLRAQNGGSGNSVLHTDKTLEEKAKGAEVVKAVIDKIQGSGIFKNEHDYSFLQRLAYAESQFGENNQTFRPSFYGGIWQISEANYQRTKGGQLASQHAEIQRMFNITWQLTSWTDLVKPLYSGLAARLLLKTFGQPIPQALTRQEAYRGRWNLQSQYGLSIGNFTTEIKRMEATQSCTGKMDLLVILDESGSVGADHYQKSLQFVANLFKSYENASAGNVRLGFVTYGDQIRSHFPMANSLSMNQIYSIVRSTSYASGGTNTNQAIQAGINHFTNGTQGYWARDGVPKIMALFTDGQSGDGVSNINAARARGITTFAVGIGASQNPTELNTIANGDPSRVFSLSDFDALTEFFGILHSATCAIPQKPEASTYSVDTLKEDEERVYCYPVPSQGITITLVSAPDSNVTGYFSYNYKTPSSALNDGVLAQLKNYIPHPSTNQGVGFNPWYFKKETSGQEQGRNCDVYVTIEGVGGPLNKYTMTAEAGNTA